MAIPGPAAVPWPFAGRDGDVAFGRDLLGGLPARGLILCGPPGIGKTRLAAELRRHLEHSARAVFHVAASPAISSLPLGALLPLIDVPETRGDSLRGSLVQASRQLAARADGEPFILSVDDGHLLDEASATVIHQLAATHAMPVLMTVRSGETVPPGVQALWKDELAERIDLTPLDPAAVGRVVAEALDRPMDVGSLHVVSATSGGNPLYLRELIIGSIESGALREIGGQWRLGEDGPMPTARLRELVMGRVEEVPPDERRLLDAFALADQEAIPFVDGLDPDGDALDDLERRGLLTIETSRRRRVVQLAHPVYAEVLAADITARRQAALMTDIALALEATGVRRREDLLRLASLQVKSSASIDARVMVKAAHQAARRNDEHLAEILAQAAWDTEGSLEAAVILGGCLSRTGRVDEAVELFESVADLDAEERQRALLAIEHAETLFYGVGDLAAATARIELAHRSIGDPTWRDQIVATGSAYKLMSGDAVGALADADRVIHDGRTKAVVSAALIASPALVLVGRPLDAIDATTEGLDARTRLEDPQGTTYDGMLLMARAFALSESGRIDEAVETAALGFEASVADGAVLGQAWFGLMRGRALLLAGRVGEAERWFQEGRSGFDELGHTGLGRWCQAGVMWAAALAGDSERAATALATFDALPPANILMLEPEMLRARAWVAVMAGDLPAAHDLLDGAADLSRAGQCPSMELAALHDLVRLGTVDSIAARLLDVGLQVQGRLAEVRRDHTTALNGRDPVALLAAADGYETIGASLLAAEAAAQAVPLLTRADDPRGAARARHRSHDLAAETGAHTPALDLAGGAALLTERERQIADLARAGQSSKAIATQLFLSPRTVDNHLQRVYDKLGISGRTELDDAIG